MGDQYKTIGKSAFEPLRHFIQFFIKNNTFFCFKQTNKQTKDKIILAKKEIVGFFSKYTILNE